jgi:hypothetical protein
VIEVATEFRCKPMKAAFQGWYWYWLPGSGDTRGLSTA